VKAAAVILLLLSSCSHPPKGRPIFVDVAASSGLTFIHNPGISGEFYMPEIMGSGAALVDIDNDGDLDVFLVQSYGGPHELYRNELIPGRGLHFTRLPFGKGGYGMGVAAGDYDGDGWTDLYITHFGSNFLLRNIGGKEFRDVTVEAGVDDPRWSTSAVFFDYDRDSQLDLVVLNYVDFSFSNNVRCMAPSGVRDYCTPRAYRPVAASLFHNQGKGRFRNVSQTSGITSASGPGLGLSVTDANDDGWPDLFVANDTAANHLWINQRDGTFREEALAAGTAYSDDGIAKAGMGVATGDFDSDNDEDLIVTNLKREGATLFRKEGPMLFSDVSLALQLRPATYPFTGFGVDWLDFDNDGWLDLFIVNGAVSARDHVAGYSQPGLLLHNEAGKRLVSTPQMEGVGRGAVFGDIDNDGDIDILITNNNGPVRLLRNDVGSRRPWLSLEVTPPDGVRSGVVRSGQPTLWRRSHRGSSYLSSGDARVHFGLGESKSYEAIVIRWPDGTEERFPGGPANRIVSLRRQKTID
jgi:enediyne biosynthesis protein E4